jgi:hypothetical protein
MAGNNKGSLRIVDQNGVPDPNGYIDLAGEFINLTDNQVDRLRKNRVAINFLKNNNRRVIDRDGTLIDPSTHKIAFVRDEDDDDDDKVKTHVSIPSGDLTNVSELSYLDRHISTITTLADGTAAGTEKARKFLFGLMMITRCR